MSESPATIQHEIAQMEQALAVKRAELEQQKQEGVIEALPHEREMLRDVIETTIPTDSTGTSTPTAQVVTPPANPASSGHTTPSYLAPELKEQVQNLINIAFTKSIYDAISQARATHNAALIDAFHDALADELYQQLLERNKLKKL